MVLRAASKIILSPLYWCIALLTLASCSITNAPYRQPFVYETKINLQGTFTAKEKKQLEPLLEQQLHDSMKVRWVQKYLVARTLRNPPVYDSSNADKSLVFMRGLLHSLGYYRDSLNYLAKVDTVNDQFRTTVTFNVVQAKLFRFDSISYNMTEDTSGVHAVGGQRDTMQQLALDNIKQSLVKKNDPFSTPALSQEIGRLTDIFHNNGFLRFSTDDMLVLWDTVGRNLIRPTLDPIEQAEQLEQIRQRRANPVADVEFRLRTTADTGRFTRYYIGNVNVYPDFSPDTALYYPSFDTVGQIRFTSYADLFKPEKLAPYIYLFRGELYRQSNFLKTQNKFNALTAWRLVSINPLPRSGQDTVDFDIKLTPAKKYQFSANLEGSRNQTPLVTIGNLLGIGVNVGVQNRNFARAANLATTNFRYGIELNATSDQSTIQTQQYALTHSIQFPRRVPIGIPLFKNSPENVRSIFALNLAYTNRTDYYTVRSVSTSWSYEKSWKNKLLAVRFPNIEYYYLDRKDSLKKLIDSNSSFRYIFNKGLILSTIANLSIAGGNKNISKLLVLSGEFSGLAASLIPSKFLDSNLNRFVRLDAEYRQTHRIGPNKRSAFAWRLFGGLGYAIPSSKYDTLNFYLPFFRQYYAGGPNSMRAWGVRRLGPGSALKSFARNNTPDRFGDMRLEANAEYRFYIANVSGVILNGALYTDMGNVWFVRPNKDFVGGEFAISKLWKDIAIGAGTGLRVDFGFLKLRFEYAYKVKDPTPDVSSPEIQNKWFYNWKWNNGQFQLGIDYPF